MSTLTTSSRRDKHAAFAAELEAKPEFQIVNAVVKHPNNSITDAIQQLKSLTVSACSQDSQTLGKHAYDTACCVLEIAAQTPFTKQPKLIMFLFQLQQTKVIDPSTNKIMKYKDDFVWTDLPTFRYTFGDELGSFDPLSTDHTPEELQRWENLTAFFALMSANIPATDFSIWALTASSYAFGPWDTPTTPTRIAVRAAAIWYMCAAQKLWDNVKDEGQDDWTREDWDMYKNGLVQSQASADKETKELIDDALEQIKMAEEGIQAGSKVSLGLDPPY